MSRHTATRRLTLHFLAAIFGTVLLAYLIWRIGPSTLVQDASRLGWGLALVIALGGVAHVVKAWAWRFTLSGEEHKVSFPKLLQLRLVSEAVGQLGVFGTAFGEGLRVSALSAEIPAACRISSVTLDRGLFIATGALVMLTGIVTAPLALSLSHSLQRYVVVFAFTLVGFLLLMALAVQKRWPILSGPHEQREGCATSGAGWKAKSQSLTWLKASCSISIVICRERFGPVLPTIWSAMGWLCWRYISSCS